MSRPRVLPCEEDAAQDHILVAISSDEEIDVSGCTSSEEVQAALRIDLSAIVVSDFWSQGPRG